MKTLIAILIAIRFIKPGSNRRLLFVFNSHPSGLVVYECFWLLTIMQELCMNIFHFEGETNLDRTARQGLRPSFQDPLQCEESSLASRYSR